MVIANNISKGFKPYTKKVCEYIVKVITEYDKMNKSYGLIENVNYITMAINNSLLKIMTDETRSIVNEETKDNLVLFNQQWAIPMEKYDDFEELVGFISKTPFNLTASHRYEFLSPLIIKYEYNDDGEFDLCILWQPLDPYAIYNVDIDKDKVNDEVFLFISSCVMVVRKVFARAIITIANSTPNYEVSMIDDNNIREKILEYFSTVFDSEYITGDELFKDCLNRELDKHEFNKEELEILQEYNKDTYAIPTLKKNIEKNMNFLNNNINNSEFTIDDESEEDEDDVFSNKYTKDIINIIENNTVIIDGEDFGTIDLPREVCTEIDNLIDALKESGSDYALNIITVSEPDKDNPMQKRINFPVFLLNTLDYNDKIICSYSKIDNENVYDSFRYIQDYLLILASRLGIARDYFIEFENFLNDPEVTQELKKKHDEFLDSNDKEEIVEEEIDEEKKEDNIDLKRFPKFDEVKKNKESKSSKVSKKNINRVEYDKPAEEFSIIEYSELLEDNLSDFINTIDTQLQLKVLEYKSIYERLRELSSCGITKYYSDDNCIDFDDIGEAISSYSFTITVNSKDKIIDSIVVFYDGDRDKYDAYRMGDKFGKYSSDATRKSFIRYYNIDTDSELNLGIMFREGFYNVSLDRLPEYLDNFNPNKLDIDFTQGKYAYDIISWVLMTLANLFTRKFIGKCKGVDTKHNNPDFYKYQDRFDTYKISDVIKCFESYVDNHIIDEYDIDNMLNVFKYKDYSHSESNLLDNSSNKVRLKLFNGVNANIVGDIQIISKEKDNYLYDPQYYFSLATIKDKDNTLYTKDDYNHLLTIDSLGDKSITDFNKEMINVLTYAKMCIEDDKVRKPRSTRNKTQRK